MGNDLQCTQPSLLQVIYNPRLQGAAAADQGVPLVVPVGALLLLALNNCFLHALSALQGKEECLNKLSINYY